MSKTSSLISGQRLYQPKTSNNIIRKHSLFSHRGYNSLHVEIEGAHGHVFTKYFWIVIVFTQNLELILT